MSSDRDKLKGGPAFWCHICNAGLEGCGHPPDERSGSATVAQVSDRDKLIAEARAEIERAASSATPNQAERILAGDSADVRLSLLVRLVAELVRDTPKETEWEYGYGYTENGRIRPVVTKGDGSIRFGNYLTIEAAQMAMDNDLRWRPELHG